MDNLRQLDQGPQGKRSARIPRTGRLQKNMGVIWAMGLHLIYIREGAKNMGLIWDYGPPAHLHQKIWDFVQDNGTHPPPILWILDFPGKSLFFSLQNSMKK